MQSIFRYFLVSIFILSAFVNRVYGQKLVNQSLSNASYVIDQNGNLYAWGDNKFGQLGIGDTTNRYLPVKVPFPDGVTGWIDVSASNNHCLAIGNDNNLYAWGNNCCGQLGIGDTTNAYLPVKIPFPVGVTGWVKIAAGISQSLAIGNDGNLYTWGGNYYGELGIGNTIIQKSPIMVPDPYMVTGWSDVSAGSYVSVAEDNHGNMYSCGYNIYGQLGIGQSANRNYFTKIPYRYGVSDYTSICIGIHFGIALGDDGNLYSWGSNVFGQLGINSSTDQNAPVKVLFPPGVTGWKSVSAGDNHCLAIGNDGNLYSWGINWEGQLGTGNTELEDSAAVLVPFPPGVTKWLSIEGGMNHSLAIGNDGKLYAWGYNGQGQLGTGDTNLTKQYSPVRVLGVNGVGDLALSTENSNKNKPVSFALEQNYPNPFNPVTQISYQLRSAQNVRISVFDITGRKVADLVRQFESAGSHSVSFRADNLSSGVYFYRIVAGDFSSVRKMIVLK